MCRLEDFAQHSDEMQIPAKLRGNIGDPNSQTPPTGADSNVINSSTSKIHDAMLLSLRGQRCSYYLILAEYERELRGGYCSGNAGLLILVCFRSLVQGMAGSALHGLIHLGYGYAAGCPRLVALHL